MRRHNSGFIRRFNHHAHSVRLKYLRWQNAHMSQSMVLILISLVLGILTGAAAAVLKLLVRWFMHSILGKVTIDHPDYRLLIWPLTGILLCSIYKRYVCRENITTGTKVIKDRLNSRNYRLSVFDIFNPIIGCSLTIGFGASAGTEGPTALSGAAIGSNVGRWFKLSNSWRRLLLGIGGGAGIAAIFKAPIGGVLFTLEVLQMELTTLPIVALILACLFSSATAYWLSDFTFDIHFIKNVPFDHSSIGWVMLLGLFCGLYSIYYNYTKTKGAKLFGSIKNPWIAALVTGSCLSVSVFMFPVLYGEGFNVITDLVNGIYISFTDYGIFAGNKGASWLIFSLIAVLLLKGLLVSASYSGGGIAGDFVPTFFAGAIAGALFAIAINSFFGLSLPIWYFALIGMGCVMAGTIHAPLMSIFLLCETTNTYAYIFPYILAILTSYFVVKIITPKAWYSETGSDDVLALMKLRQTPNLIFRKNKSQQVPSDQTSGTQPEEKYEEPFRTEDKMQQDQKPQ